MGDKPAKRQNFMEPDLEKHVQIRNGKVEQSQGR